MRKKCLCYFSVGLNILVLAVILAAVAGGKTLMRITVMKLGYDARVSKFESYPINTGDIVFLGDSITEGGSWHEMFPGVPVKNRGIGGDTTEGVIARIHQITDGRPSKVFLLIGTNDLGYSEPINTVVENINIIVSSIQDNSAETEIFVQSILPRAARYRERVEVLNAAVKKSIEGKARWIDLYPLFLDRDDGSIRNDLSIDELHLMGKGYVLWQQAIQPLIQQ
jgi:GDSL-like lipase/acylhydrolase family protein